MLTGKLKAFILASALGKRPDSAHLTSYCYAYTIKKSGSHLLRNVLQELGLECVDCLSPGTAAEISPGDKARSSFVLSLERPSIYWRGSCQRGGVKIIFNLRDPRAVFLSLIDFYDWRIPLSGAGLPTVEFRRAACRAMFKSRDELAMDQIAVELLDDDPSTPLANFRRSRTLYHNPNVLKIRYEELCAGTAEPAAHPVARICNYLGIESSAESREVVQRAVSADSLTKNVGDPNRWKRELSPVLLAAFMEKNGDLVREFGYSDAC